MEFAIEVQGLEKYFQEHVALKGINFCVPKGSIYGFLGPNGAGKTTTIKILLSLTAASKGQIKVLGQEVVFGGKGDFLAHLGYLPQDPVFPEGLTGREALELVGGIYNLDRKKSDKKIVELLKEFQLEEAAKRKVNAYSRGMKQRLGIAAVLLSEPELLILDEPVSALDPEGRRKVLELILKLKGKATVFFSSHILADVERVCDHIAVIDGGVKLIETETKELLNQYAMEQYIVGVRQEHNERATELLNEQKEIRQLEKTAEGIIVTSNPGHMGRLSEEILPLLIKEGIIVTEFRQRRVDLEEVFFKVLEEAKGGEGSVNLNGKGI